MSCSLQSPFTWEAGFLTLINVPAEMFVHLPD